MNLRDAVDAKKQVLKMAINTNWSVLKPIKNWESRREIMEAVNAMAILLRENKRVLT